jgi:hypothetical protein
VIEGEMRNRAPGLIRLTGVKALVALLAFALSKPASAEDFYCPAGVVDTDLNSLAARCQPGDVIQLEAKKIGLIGSACDFTKTIVTVPSMKGTQILCVMVPPRTTR